ncbi:hypothetical protein IWQ56_001270 [Coemansia nantahalensis]|uniref:Uncharacterized protein n=1 Tax=Coemansia nantahalensis TaxID=2789366 RepID=A0ACC1K3J8_9FUNG|nr:hypothetical protein IWQ57_001687 [Coemansia nantahalensis]KAJ2772684.1 hypothetical protein IWQ56_001270 [Coemansia nantahalensis]
MAGGGLAGQIARRDDISVEDFVRDFLEPNVPVVLGPRFTDGWTARRLWVTADGRPDYARLAALYGDAQVPVAECGTAFFSDQQRTTMPFSAFVEAWQRGPRAGLYCKDWHFARHGAAPQAYAPAPPLSNDWLNVFYDHGAPELDDDYRFCYMGGDGTWTPFHEDVFRSYSWSANICGAKQWLLVAPGQNELFTDQTGSWVYDMTAPDEARFPRARQARRIEFVQHAGETVFVPSGWWHQVRNIGDTISINHNWANEFNLRFLYARLKDDMAAVRHALRDAVDMDGFAEHAQLVLRADSGTDYRAFFRFVDYMARLYLRELGGGSGGVELRGLAPHFRAEPSLRRALRLVAAVLDQLAADPAARELEQLPADIARTRALVAGAVDDPPPA